MHNTITKLYELMEGPERKRLLLLLATVMISAITETVGIGLVFGFMRLAVDTTLISQIPILESIYRVSGTASPRQFLIISGVVIIVFYCLKNIVSVSSTWAQDQFSFGMTHSVSVRLIKSYLSMPYAWFITKNTAMLNRSVLFESLQLGSHLILGITCLVADGAIVVSLISVLLWHDWKATLIIITMFASVYLIFHFAVRRRTVRKGKQRLKLNEKRFKVAQETFSGFKEIKLSTRSTYFINRYAEVSKTFVKQLIGIRTLNQLPRNVMEATGIVSVLAIVLLYLWQGAPMENIIPTITLYALVGFRMLPSFSKITKSIADIQFYTPVLDSIYDDIRAGIDATENAPSDKPLQLDGAIRIVNLHFRYPESETDSINGISLTIPKNTSMAFVGATGAGKSTLIELICGLLPPTAGAIFVDNQQIEANTIRAWQRNIGYVPQHIYLLDDTLARNIAFGVDDNKIDMEAVRRAAALAHLADFIENELPLGYNTVAGERGIRLSGGQRQRLGIARALYFAPQVLIMDEATSALDSVTERIVSEAITSLSGEITLLIIAHRLSTVALCDQICLMENGRIIDRGTYDTLMVRSAKFRLLSGQTEQSAAP